MPRGDGIWTSRASLYDTLRVPLTFLHKPCSHSSIKTALKLQKRSGIHSAYTDGGILPARSSKATLCTNISIFAMPNPERQITHYCVLAQLSSLYYQIPAPQQKRFHSRSGSGYGILLYIRKKPTFCPLTAHFGGFWGVFSYKTDKSASSAPQRQIWRILYV